LGVSTLSVTVRIDDTIDPLLMGRKHTGDVWLRGILDSANV